MGPQQVLLLLLAPLALSGSAAAQCGGNRQPACIDENGNPFCTFVPPGGGRSAPNAAGRCVECGFNGKTPCIGELSRSSTVLARDSAPCSSAASELVYSHLCVISVACTTGSTGRALVCHSDKGL